MVTCVYSVKGGAGVTTFVSIVALATSQTMPTVVIDLCGDLPVAFGVAASETDGIYDWLHQIGANAGGASVGSGQLRRFETTIGEGLSLVGIGAKARWCASVGPGVDQDWYTALATRLLEAAHADGRRVLLDVGTLPVAETFVECWAPSPRLRWELALRAPQRILVTRACYLGLRAASSLPVAPTEIALVREAGRALSLDEVETAIGAEISIQVDFDPAIARAVDSGLLTTRVPKALRKTVARVVAHA